MLAATAAAVIVGYAVVATAAEQDQQDDDPQAVVPTETIVIHNAYLQHFFEWISPLIPWYSTARIW